MNTRLGATLVIVFLAAAVAQAQTPQGSGFTYQGRLDNVNGPANGLHDLRFRLYDALTNGTPIGAAVCVNNVNVVDGVFTVPLDFGAQFAGQERFLQIEVRADTGLDCANPAGLILLTPRQALTATPYASFAARPWATIGSDISYVGGSVGIGTESPLGPLDVRSGAGSFLYMDAANGDLRYNGGADGFFGFFNDGVAAGGTVFASHTTVHMSISNTGIVGIGTPPVTGTRLKVAGTVEADEFRFAAAKAINISIDSASFTPVDSSEIADSGEGRYAIGPGVLSCSVSLPDGMVITELRWFLRDVSNQNLRVVLHRISRPYANGSPIELVSSGVSDSAPGVTLLVRSVNHTVDNVNATYRLSAFPVITGNSWDGGLLGIQGVTIVGTIRTPR